MGLFTQKSRTLSGLWLSTTVIVVTIVFGYLYMSKMCTCCDTMATVPQPVNVSAVPVDTAQDAQKGRSADHAQLSVIDRLRLTAEASGYKQCQATPTFTPQQLKDAIINTAGYLNGTAEVPCRYPTQQHIDQERDSGRPPCCSRDITFRYNSTDFHVFQTVIMSHEFSFLYDVFGKDEPRYILDAGANAGFASVLFKHIFPNAIVVGVEPDADNYQAVLRNTHGFDDFHALQAGLWGWAANITVAERDRQWGYVFKEAPPGTTGTPAFSVMDIAAQHKLPHFDLLKIDIEGAEGMVFDPRSDLSWLDRAKVVTLELHPRQAKNNFQVEDLEARIDAAFQGKPYDKLVHGELVMYIAKSLVLTP